MFDFFSIIPLVNKTIGTIGRMFDPKINVKGGNGGHGIRAGKGGRGGSFITNDPDILKQSGKIDASGGDGGHGIDGGDGGDGGTVMFFKVE